MPLTINTNFAASLAAGNLNRSNGMLQKSLARLSSGSKITSPADDAGGLGVSMRLEAALKRTDATNVALSNATSFLQVQDGGLKNAGKVVQRMAELKVLSTDVTKSPTDVASYSTEFTALQGELFGIGADKFNGVSLFVPGGATLTVATSEDGTQSMTLTQSDFAAAIANISLAPDLSVISTQNIEDTLTAIGTARAQNGAESSRLGLAMEQLVSNRESLEAADSRIVDTDVAMESARLARSNILVQVGTAMLAQANTSAQSALRLLQS